MEKERSNAGWKNWEVAKAVARNRECWSENVTALCTMTRHDDDDEPFSKTHGGLWPFSPSR